MIKKWINYCGAGKPWSRPLDTLTGNLSSRLTHRSQSHLTDIFGNLLALTHSGSSIFPAHVAAASSDQSVGLISDSALAFVRRVLSRMVVIFCTTWFSFWAAVTAQAQGAALRLWFVAVPVCTSGLPILVLFPRTLSRHENAGMKCGCIGDVFAVCFKFLAVGLLNASSYEQYSIPGLHAARSIEDS